MVGLRASWSRPGILQILQNFFGFNPSLKRFERKEWLILNNHGFFQKILASQETSRAWYRGLSPVYAASKFSSTNDETGVGLLQVRKKQLIAPDYETRFAGTNKCCHSRNLSPLRATAKKNRENASPFQRVQRPWLYLALYSGKKRARNRIDCLRSKGAISGTSKMAPFPFLENSDPLFEGRLLVLLPLVIPKKVKSVWVPFSSKISSTANFAEVLKVRTRLWDERGRGFFPVPGSNINFFYFWIDYRFERWMEWW